ncbi:Conserved_hypothetical protein [Hexamita inflata]|uniref:Uncharacterized protein n=1 Tax=Hexamita inflata TaxID=28002 RepID=A0AA86V2V4_9EUKA|nr:Conserved hypothetical protein [Hexamita inflata]
MSVWNEILVKVGKKYNIISWGREIDAGRSFGILRLSTVFMKAHHILALCQAIEQGAHLLQEISIHFSAFEDKHDQLVNPFLPRGIHYQYLSYLDHPIPQVCNPYPQKKTGTIYDRLNGEGQGKASTDLKPKDKEKTELTEQMNSSKGFQLALQKLMKTICGKVQEMCNLKLLAFYNLNIQNFSIKQQNELQDGLYKGSTQLDNMEPIFKLLQNKNNMEVAAKILEAGFGKFIFDKMIINQIHFTHVITTENFMMFKMQADVDLQTTNNGTFLSETAFFNSNKNNTTLFYINQIDATIQLSSTFLKIQKVETDYTFKVENQVNLANIEIVNQMVKGVIDQRVLDAVQKKFSIELKEKEDNSKTEEQVNKE